MDPSAGLDRGLDQLPLPVYNMTRSLEQILAGTIRAVFANDERLERLIIGGRTFLTCRFNDLSRHRDRWFCGYRWFLARLRECHRRNQGAAGYGGYCFFNLGEFLLNVTVVISRRYNGEYCT